MRSGLARAHHRSQSPQARFLVSLPLHERRTVPRVAGATRCDSAANSTQCARASSSSLPLARPETAYQIINISDAELCYLCVSTMIEPDVCEYPDSGKFAVLESPKPGSAQAGRTWAAVRDEAKCGYWEGE